MANHFMTLHFKQQVGNLVYLNVMQPNISYVIVPWSSHYATILQILWYLKNTLLHELYFSFTLPLTLWAYIDADQTGNPIHNSSIIGFFFLRGNLLMAWHRKKQTLVARSSIEAEYRALCWHYLNSCGYNGFCKIQMSCPLI